jgi:hypothetical protein
LRTDEKNRGGADISAQPVVKNGAGGTLPADNDQGGPEGANTDGGAPWGTSADADGANACEVTGAAWETKGLGTDKVAGWGANADL